MKLIGGRGAVRSQNNQNHGSAYRLPHFLLPCVFALFALLRLHTLCLDLWWLFSFLLCYR